MQGWLKENLELESKLEAKERSLADSEQKVTSLEAQTAECKMELEATKASSEATIKTQGEEIVNLKKITDKIPADLLKLPAQLTVDNFELI